MRGNARLRQQTKTGVDTVGGTPSAIMASTQATLSLMAAWALSSQERDRLTPGVTQLFERERAGSGVNAFIHAFPCVARIIGRLSPCSVAHSIAIS